MLVRTLKTDVVQTAIIPITKKHSAENIVEERMHILQKIWPAFSQWWLQYLKINKVEDIPVDTLWRFYIPLSQWVVEQKRSLRPDDVYVVGIYGSQGRGKTVTALALVSVLTRLLYFAISGVNVILLGPIPSSG